MATRTYISFDWAIKKLLRQKANFVVLEGFISSVLDKTIKIDCLLESESNKDRSEEKSSRVDILAQDLEGNKYIIEVQNESEMAYFQRILFGVSRFLKDYLHHGDNYEKVKKIYSINIVYFDLGRGSDYVYVGKTELRGVHTGDLLTLSPFQQEKLGVKYPSELYPEYVVLKVNDLDKHAVTNLEQWMDFLKTSTIPDTATAPGLPEARTIMELDKMGEADKRAYENHLMNLAIIRDQVYTARGEGMMAGYEEGLIKGQAEGRAEGRAEEKMAIARSMKDDGEPIDRIIRYTGLTEEEIKEA